MSTSARNQNPQAKKPEHGSFEDRYKQQYTGSRRFAESRVLGSIMEEVQTREDEIAQIPQLSASGSTNRW